MSFSCFAGLSSLAGRSESKSARPPERRPSKATLTSGVLVDEMEAWITPEEAGRILELRANLSQKDRSQLESAPEDIRHDLMMCRFLRGHGNKVPQALRALRAHLQFREDNAALMRKVRSKLPPDLIDFDEKLFLADHHGLSRFRALQESLKLLTLPARCGSNGGAPISLVPIGLLQFQELGEFTEDLVNEWFISLMEMRSLSLHNQSMQERRMVKVIEARDCNGFSFSQFFSAMKVTRLFKKLVKTATLYPEVVSMVMLFNLTPGATWVWMFKHIVPQQIMDKLFLCDRGDWSMCVCTPRGFTIDALCRWNEHINSFRLDRWERLTPVMPQVCRALRVRQPGQTFSWIVRCSERIAEGALKVKVYFFAEDGRKVPTISDVYHNDRCQSDDGLVCKGNSESTSAGMALLEVELNTGRTLAVVALLGFDGATEETAIVPLLPPPQSTTDRFFDGDSSVSWFLIGTIAALVIAIVRQMFSLSQAGITQT